MKSRVALLLSVSVVAWGLALAGTALGGDPDHLYIICVDEATRANVRAARDDCDLSATGSVYHAGVLRPCNAQLIQCSQSTPCLFPLVSYQCVGVPETQ